MLIIFARLCGIIYWFIYLHTYFAACSFPGVIYTFLIKTVFACLRTPSHGTKVALEAKPLRGDAVVSVLHSNRSMLYLPVPPINAIFVICRWIDGILKFITLACGVRILQFYFVRWTKGPPQNATVDLDVWVSVVKNETAISFISVLRCECNWNCIWCDLNEKKKWIVWNMNTVE